MIAYGNGQKRSSSSHWPTEDGSLPVRLPFEFLAAAGQAGGFFLLRPLMAQGIDPIAALAVRAAIAAVA